MSDYERIARAISFITERVRSQRGICKLAFLSKDKITVHLDELNKKWPHAVTCENHEGTFEIVESMFGGNMRLDQPLSLHVSGTNFQISVWKALLEIPPGTVTSYTQDACNTCVGVSEA